MQILVCCFKLNCKHSAKWFSHGLEVYTSVPAITTPAFCQLPALDIKCVWLNDLVCISIQCFICCCLVFPPVFPQPALFFNPLRWDYRKNLNQCINNPDASTHQVTGNYCITSVFIHQNNTNILRDGNYHLACRVE